jgi:hypothetical protein
MPCARRARYESEFITIQQANIHFSLLEFSGIARFHLGRRHDQNFSIQRFKYDVCVVTFIYVLLRSKAVVCKNCIGETVFFYFLITRVAALAARVLVQVATKCMHSVKNRGKVLTRSGYCQLKNGVFIQIESNFMYINLERFLSSSLYLSNLNLPNIYIR